MRASMSSNENILEIDDLRVHFPVRGGVFLKLDSLRIGVVL